MKGWRGSIEASLRVCGPGRSALLLLLMVAVHFSASGRRLRPLLARRLLRLFGAPDPIRLSLRRPRCSVWLRPFDGGDVQSFLEVFVRRIYPIPEGGVVVDAGANIGLFSVFAFVEDDPEYLVAIEPDSGNVRLLRRNLARFGERAVVLEAALWSKEGRARFAVTGQSNLGHLVSASGIEAVSSGESFVRTVAPDSAGVPSPETIDYLKLDIEGSERAVLDEYLRRMSPGALLVGELHGAATIDRFGPVLRDRWELVEDNSPDALVFRWTP